MTFQDECGPTDMLKENTSPPQHSNDFQENQLAFLYQYGFHTDLAPRAKTF